jgi:hypothetical protein
MKNIALVVLLVLFMPSSPCFANLSGPWKPGQLLVDVEGVKEIAIIREKLGIDLRPLKDGGMIKISATYLIDHPHSPKDLPLTFITGVESVKEVKCTLNGIPLAFNTTQVMLMPDSWKPPDNTPGFVPEEKLLYSRNISDTQHEWILFIVPLQTGRQTIEVTYEVEAGAYYSERYSAKFWQTAYILAPARTWKSFGGLDIEVLAPENWQVKGNLPLMNQGQRWWASFDSLPADFIALTTQHPSGKRVTVVDPAQMLYFFGFLTFIIGLQHARKRFQQIKSNPVLEHGPKCYHLSGLLFLLSFLPLVWNCLSIIWENADVPPTQGNYQLPVINIYFYSMYWLIFIVPLMLFSRAILWLFCLLGSWLVSDEHGGAEPDKSPTTRL